MIRLFKSDATKFETNGIGLLDQNATECMVDEELNGMFELTLTYPVGKRYYKELNYGNIIVAKPNPYDEPEPFRIYQIDKNSDGTITAYARHISYQLSYIPVIPFAAANLDAALSLLKSNATEPCPFNITARFSKEAVLDFYEPKSMRAVIGDGEESIIEVYGGEVIFSGYDITLVEKRGADRGFQVRYGKDLMSVSQEESIADTITGVMPFWKQIENVEVGGETYQIEKAVYLAERTVHTENYNQFPFPRTVPLDLSQVFEEEPTQDELRYAANLYIEKNDLGKPEISLSVEYVDLRQTEEYKYLPIAKEVRLGDDVKVYFEELGVNSSGRIIATHYDAINNKYASVDLGKAQTNLSNSIATASSSTKSAIKKQQDSSELSKQQMIAMVNKSIADSKAIVEQEILESSKAIRGANGGYIRLNMDEANNPYEILAMDQPDINSARKVVRINNEGIGFSNNGYDPSSFNVAITSDGTINGLKANIINLDASEIKTGVLRDHDGNTTIDLSDGLIMTKTFLLDSANLQIVQNGTIRTIRLRGGMDSYDSYMSIAGAYLEMGVLSHSQGGSAPDEYNENYFTAGALDGSSTSGKMNSSFNLQSHGITFDLDNIFVTRARRYIGITPTSAQADFPVQGGTGSIQIGNQTLTFVNGIMVTALT